MPNFPFMQVDAFTDVPLSGNACAVLFDTDALDEDLMLSVAREMNLAETAFVRHSEVSDFGVRFFTPREEIPLAGHPTIATAFALARSGRLHLKDPSTEVTFELKDGPIKVVVHAENNRPGRIIMTQRKPRFMKIHEPEAVLPVFGLTPGDLIPGAPIQTVSTGTPQLMVPLKNKDALRRAHMDIPAYRALYAESDFFSPHLFCLGGVTEAGSTFARHLDAPPDLLEDPFTGSATGGMAAYLWHYQLIEEPRFVAEQGHWMNRPGKAYVEIVGPREAIEKIKVGGKAVAVMHGHVTI